MARGGTKYYAAPEQAIFPVGSSEYDEYWSTPSSDVYGATAVLFHLLFGRPPYSDEATVPLDFVVVQAMIWHGKLSLWHPADHAAPASPALRHLLAAGLAPRPEGRPASMSAQRDVLLACPEATTARLRVLAAEVGTGRWASAVSTRDLLRSQYPEWSVVDACFLEAMLQGPPLANAPPEAIAAAFSSLCAIAEDAASRPLVLRAVVSIGGTWGDAVGKSRALGEHFRGQPGATALGTAFLTTFQPEPALTFLDPAADTSLRALAMLLLGRFSEAIAALRGTDRGSDGDDVAAGEARFDDLGHVVYAITSTLALLPEAVWPARFDRPCSDVVPGLCAVYMLVRAIHLADTGNLEEGRKALVDGLRALEDVSMPEPMARRGLWDTWSPPRRTWVHRFRRSVLEPATVPPKAARARWLRAIDQRREGSGAVHPEVILLEMDIALTLFLSSPGERGPELDAIRAMAERPGAPREAQLRLARALLHVGAPNDALAIAQKVLPASDAHEEQLWVEIVGGAVLSARRSKAS